MTAAQTTAVIEIGCAGGCGKKVLADEVEKSGWSFLHITNRWRCGECERDLLAAAYLEGYAGGFAPDPLPADSIGALKKLPERQPLHEKVKP